MILFLFLWQGMLARKGRVLEEVMGALSLLLKPVVLRLLSVRILRV